MANTSLRSSSPPVCWAPISAAAPLGGHRDISSAGLLLWEGLPQSHVHQYIQWDEASLLPTENSDEAVLFFLGGHTDLRARGQGEKGKDFSSAGRSGDPAAEVPVEHPAGKREMTQRMESQWWGPRWGRGAM